MPIYSSMGLVMVIMVASGMSGGGGKRGKVGWMVIGIGEDIRNEGS